MTKISYYIIKVIMKPLLLSLFILIGMIWLLQSIKLMDLLINGNAKLADFVFASVLTLPDMLMVLIPLAVFFGTYAGLRKMVNDSEMDAIFAAGISRVDIVKPTLVVAGIFSVFTYFVGFYALPKARTSFYELRDDIQSGSGSLLIEPGTFNSLGGKLTVYVQSISNNQLLKNIIVYDRSSPESPVTWTAEEGVLEKDEGSPPRLVLINGTRQELGEEQTSVLEFESHQIDISKNMITTKVLRNKKPQERFFHELFDTEHLTLEKDKDRFRIEIYRRMLWPLAPFSMVIIPLFFLFAPIKRRFGQAKPSAYSIIFAILFIVLQLVFNSNIVVANSIFVILSILLALGVPIVFLLLIIRENFK